MENQKRSKRYVVSTCTLSFRIVGNCKLMTFNFNVNGKVNVDLWYIIAHICKGFFDDVNKIKMVRHVTLFVKNQMYRQ